MRQSALYIVDAFWDNESGVWVATSNQVLGLATEAPTIEQLTQKLHVMIPELIQANQLIPSDYQGAIGFERVRSQWQGANGRSIAVISIWQDDRDVALKNVQTIVLGQYPNSTHNILLFQNLSVPIAVK